MNPPAIAWDIEATGLVGDYGHLLCACILNMDNAEVEIFRLDDERYRQGKPHDDSALVKAIRDRIEDSFMWITWNGKWYDVPMLDTRLRMAGEQALRRKLHADIMYYARRPFIDICSSKLSNFAKAFLLEQRKIDLDPIVWEGARALDSECMDKVVEHCVADVLILYQAWPILCPYIKNIHY